MVSEKSLANLKLGPFARKNRPTIHGHAIRGKKSPTYGSWLHMVQRVKNKKEKRYYDYGGRGIQVCDRWLKFENFLADMGERPKDKSIDRVDNNGHYEPSNCRWATRKEQADNKRNTIFIEYDGKLKTINQWAVELKIEPDTLRCRIKRGWTAKRAIETPLNVKRKTKRGN